MRDIITKLEELNEGLADMAHEAEKDHEVQMARSDCYKSAKYAVAIHKMLKDVSEMEGIDGWVASKITKAADYLGSVKHYMEGQAMSDVELAVVPVAGDMTDAMTIPQESVEEVYESINEGFGPPSNGAKNIQELISKMGADTPGDIIADIMHWADENDMEFSDLVKQGTMYYNDEKMMYSDNDDSEEEVDEGRSDYIPKGMTPEQIMELIDMLEPQGYDKDFLLKDLADMMQEGEDVIGDIIGKLAQGKAGVKGGKDVIGDIIAKLPKDTPATGSKPAAGKQPAISAVTKQKVANKMALPTPRPERPRSMGGDTTASLSTMSNWSKK